MMRLYYRAHQEADTAGGHSTEENLLTIQVTLFSLKIFYVDDVVDVDFLSQDLRNIFVDSDEITEVVEDAGAVPTTAAAEPRGEPMPIEEATAAPHGTDRPGDLAEEEERDNENLIEDGIDASFDEDSLGI